MYINDNSIYATGWYSLSPAFARWNTDVHRLAAEKQRELLKKIRSKKRLTLQKLQKEQSRYMLSKRKSKKSK
jgi:hypothetical protein